MKARIKATGEIGIVANIDILFGCKGYRYQSDEVEIIDSYAEVDTDADPDYWTRLEHQAGIAAMQGMLNNNLLSSVLFKIGKTHEDYINEVVNVADEYAKALITRMKNV